MAVPRRIAIRFAERFQPVMKILKLMSRAAIFASIATAAQAGAGAMVAIPDSSSAAAHVAGQDSAPIVRVQYGDGGWNGQPGWQGNAPGQQNWPSQWGGGWYGGWYQPYWGQSGWTSPNWTYGSPNYYGNYPAPSACGPNGCGQPAPDYPPLK
jgi:hypothetical protein